MSPKENDPILKNRHSPAGRKDYAQLPSQSPQTLSDQSTRVGLEKTVMSNDALPTSGSSYARESTPANSSPSIQKPSPSGSSGLRQGGQHYDLLGVGSFSNSPLNSQDARGRAINSGQKQCPVHKRSFKTRLVSPRSHEASPMHRYLAEDRSEQSAILHGTTSRNEASPVGCTCFDITKSLGNGDDGNQKH
ncbi:hypothetical protein ACLMJK_009530 [Lecanora helva]